MAAPEEPKSTIAILSIGDMGGSIARLLISKGFRIVTDVTGRSAHTISRVKSAGVETLPLSSIVQEASAILSIVPPADARSKAESVLSALSSSTRSPSSPGPLTYVDLNAISPSTARSISSLFPVESSTITFVDGAIIGHPPSLSASSGEWSVPQFPTSGPQPLPPWLSSALESYHVSPDIGSASGLKMCFASLSKGYTATAVQAFTTAHRLGVVGHLREAVEKTIPSMKPWLDRGVTGMPPKAYRWVREMEEIADTHREEGGWGEVGGADIFTGAARVYGFVADGTLLGEEKVGGRVRGTSVEDVARAVAEGLGELERGGRERREVEGRVEREDGGEDAPNPMKRMWEEDKAN